MFTRSFQKIGRNLSKKILFLFSIALFLINSSSAQTYVSGGIYSNTTWTLAGSPYIVTGNIVVFSGKTLRIQPGVTVKFDSTTSITIYGSLYANGTATDSIIFTSNNASPYAGIYGGVGYGGDTLSIRYCRFSYANNALYTGGSAFSFPITHCTFISDNCGISNFLTISNNPVVDTCIFQYDTTGIYQSSGGETIGCRFYKDGTGILYPNGPLLNCIFSNNEYGIFNGMGILISYCTFDSNSTGLSIHGYNDVTNCSIKYNGVGIFSESNTITLNDISDNQIGIETIDDIAISCNTICSNTQYSIVSESNTNESVSNNYWCLPDSAHIQATIYDAYQDIYDGFIYFTPFDTVSCTHICNLSVTATATRMTVCHDSTVLTANVTDANPVYTAVWNPGNYHGLNYTVSPSSDVTYTVVVTDSSGCKDSAFVTIDTSCAPHACILSVNIFTYPDSICLGNSAILNSVVFDTIPNSIPYWMPGGYSGNSYSVTPLATTTYTVFVHDSNGCHQTDTITIVVSNGPIVTIAPIAHAFCPSAPPITLNGTPAGGSFSGTGVIGNVFYPNLASGETVITYSYSSGGCTGSASDTTMIGSQPPPSICYVTTDTSGTFNTVVWQKTGMDTLAIDSVIIYRQNVLSIYVPIGKVSVHAYSAYNDHTARPAIEPYFYALGVDDTCGVDSTLSNVNKTVLLQSSVGLGHNVVDLNWNFYQGNPVRYYRILRDDSGRGNWHAIDSVQGSINAYTDRNAPVNPGLRYILNTDWNVVCTPSYIIRPHVMNHYGFVAGEAYSNPTYLFPTGTMNLLDNNSITIFPNPVSSNVSISFNQAFKGTVAITDLLGQQVYYNTDFTSEKGNTEQIDLSNLKSGIYFITLQSADGVIRKKILKI